ncbi:MAG: fatty acid desaturase CarF family protein [Cypionkella sp.]
MLPEVVLETAGIAVQLFLLITAADFLGGLFHWAEDTLGTVDTPIWGPIFVKPSSRHHDHPTDIMTVPWLRGASFILMAGAVVLVAAWLLNVLSWQLVLFAVLAGLNDQAHRLEHTPTKDLPRAVQLLRRAHLLQDARHHWQHHKAPHTSHYCVLTPWLNPVLDGLGFWRGLEKIVVPIFGAPRRPDLM